MNWLLSIALKKAVKESGKVAIGGALAGLLAAKPLLAQFGVNLEWDEVAVVAAVTGLLDIVRNFLKVKLGIKWL